MKAKLDLKSSSAGVTLVELLVAMGIGLILVLAATSTYLLVRKSATAVSNLSDANETGSFALDIIGRELQMAGFYPTSFPGEIGSNTLSLNERAFRNTKAVGQLAYDSGIFGCSGAVFNPVTSSCDTSLNVTADAAISGTALAPDSLVVNYFETNELSSAATPSTVDCLNNNVANDASNALLIASAGALPNIPLYVSNRFALSATTFKAGGVGGIEVGRKTRSLGCSGNAQNPETTQYQPLLVGVVDMTFSYGITDDVVSYSPSRYMTATEVATAPVIDGKTAWQRVSSVKVCILMKTLETARGESNGVENRKFNNCRGQSITYSGADRALFRIFERTFAIRNNLPQRF